jgi:molybdopterin-guanine dinucleotide biosynthesis protein A
LPAVKRSSAEGALLMGSLHLGGTPLNLLDLVVNAGGESRRMGRNKALLPVPPGGTPLIVHIIARLLPLVRGRVMVVSNDPEVDGAVATLPQVTTVRDRWVGGALGGIATGMTQCAAWAMVAACDMPLVQPAIFARLAAHAAAHPDLDAVIPRVGGQAQPFHGLWHRRGLPVLEAQITAGALGVQAALARLNVGWLSEDDLGIREDDFAFYNVNTPEEWRTVLARLAYETQ